MSFKRLCWKMRWSSGRRWQYGNALHAGQVRLQARKHTPAPLHLLLHTHTHAEICNNYCFTTTTVFSWKGLNVTLHGHCVSLERYMSIDNGLSTLLWSLLASYSSLFTIFLDYCVINICVFKALGLYFLNKLFNGPPDYTILESGGSTCSRNKD
jgi:hypothetical protein